MTLRGTAVDQGGYRSLLGAFELGASSPHPDREAGCGFGFPHGPAIYVGAASNVAVETAGARTPPEARLSFGISTWGNWREVTPRGTYVLVDTDKDGTSDRLQTVREKGPGLPADEGF